MGSNMADPERAVAAIFNSAIAAASIATAWDLGILDEIKQHRMLDVQSFALKHGLEPSSTQGLITSLVTVNVVRRGNDTGSVVAGSLFYEAYRTKAFFHWLSIGSGNLFARMPHVMRNKNRVGNYYQRDSAAIAYACRDVNRQHFDPVFWAVMDGLRQNHLFTSVVDLGSGSGERLMQVLERYPEATGIGVDVAGPAIQFAMAEATSRGFGDRLSFTQGDATELGYSDEFANVDLITCFLMGHDFWPRESCIKSLRRLRSAFPNVRRFLLGDTARGLLGSSKGEDNVNENDVPIFTLGFEFGHAMMGAYLPTIEEWESVFSEGGWRCARKHAIKLPACTFIFELEPLEGNVA